jgi:hypothetical protein
MSKGRDTTDWGFRSACIDAFRFLEERGYRNREDGPFSVRFESENVIIHVFWDESELNLNLSTALANNPKSGIGFHEMQIALGRTDVDVYRPSDPHELKIDVARMSDRISAFPAGILQGASPSWDALSARVRRLREIATELSNRRSERAIAVGGSAVVQLGYDRATELLDKNRRELIASFQPVLIGSAPIQ